MRHGLCEGFAEGTEAEDFRLLHSADARNKPTIEQLQTFAQQTWGNVWQRAGLLVPRTATY